MRKQVIMVMAMLLVAAGNSHGRGRLPELTVAQALQSRGIADATVIGFVSQVGGREVELCDRGGGPCLLVFVPVGEKLPKVGDRVKVREKCTGSGNDCRLDWK